jgi:hypothetical protein
MATIPGAQPVLVDDAGQIQSIPEPMPYEQAAAMTAKGKDGTEKRLDTLTPQQLGYVVEHNKSAELVDAALTVLEHDHQIPRPGAD